MILIDLNIILDVVQHRQPYYPYSAKIIDSIVMGKNKGAVSIHSVTTLHYLVNKYCGFEKAQEVIAWLLQHFEVISLEKKDILKAYSLQWKDFFNSPVLAITPENFII
ncbi:type II toxin-antitoxin system VapC family toxin [Geminocystis herdmanii]|uniref:type II toxin-antitoxin system VapC family toxin n=1 Tax=Geminocystis herdmanii TaxID=669359 RepID=UPI00037934EB|nr:PIN domain-containing protein [Geminocystis herdmanii]